MYNRVHPPPTPPMAKTFPANLPNVRISALNDVGGGGQANFVEFLESHVSSRLPIGTAKGAAPGLMANRRDHANLALKNLLIL